LSLPGARRFYLAFRSQFFDSRLLSILFLAIFPGLLLQKFGQSVVNIVDLGYVVSNLFPQICRLLVIAVLSFKLTQANSLCSRNPVDLSLIIETGNVALNTRVLS